MSVTLQLRGDTAANWTTANPVLHPREMALETDTGKMKVGDGVTAWSSLSYWGGTGGGGGVSSVTAADSSVVVGGTSSAPTVRTSTLDAIAAAHPPAGSVPMNAQKHTGLANGSAATDSTAFGQTPAGGATVTVPQGGTGKTSFTAYGLVAAGTTSTGAMQQVSGTGTSGQVLTSAGAGALPTWQNPPAAGGTLTSAIAPAVATLTDGSSVALNAALGNDFRWSLGGSSHTLAAPSNPVNGQSITIAIKYGGAYTPLFSSVFDFGSAGQPAWTATSGKTDYVGFRYDAALNGGAGSWAYQGFVPGLTS